MINVNFSVLRQHFKKIKNVMKGSKRKNYGKLQKLEFKRW